MPTIYPPYVIERSPRGGRSYDIFTRLLLDRIIFLGTPVNDDVANIVERVGASVVALQARRSYPASAVILEPGVVATAAHTLRRAGFSKLVIALTAGSGDALESDLLASGFDAVVFKPVSGPHLVSVITGLLAGQRDRSTPTPVAKAAGLT